jgi:hypothetical protein
MSAACWIALCVLAATASRSFAVEQKAPGLTPHEERLASRIGFDREVLLLVREEAKNDLHRLIGYDEKGYQILAAGIVVSVQRNRTDQVLRELREKLRPRKYQAFLIEMNDAIRSDKIGIIRGTDPYEILQVMHTNGDVDDISHEDIIEQLKTWEKKYPFDIIGAENDWVEIEFRSVPANLKSLVDEVSDFSPDAVDEEAGGNTADLVKSITATKRLMLLWE